jgi:hypothetical protein
MSGTAHAKLSGSAYRLRLSSVAEHPPNWRDAQRIRTLIRHPNEPSKSTVPKMHDQNDACADHALIRGVGHSLVPISKVHVYPRYHRRHRSDEIGIGGMAKCRLELGKIDAPTFWPTSSFTGESAMTITSMPTEECSEQERVVRPVKNAGNGGFKLLTATLKRRALKRNLKNQKPRSRVVTSGTESDV